MQRKWIRMAYLIVLALFMVIEFQNCAPQPGADSAANRAAPGSGVSIIDPNLGATQLNFQMDEVSADSSAPAVVVTGECQQMQSGAVLHWDLLDQNQTSVQSGYVTCNNGTFTIQVAMNSNLSCEVPYQLVAELGVSESPTVVIHRLCPTVDSTVAQACGFEKTSGTNLNSCSQVCVDSSNQSIQTASADSDLCQEL